MPRTPQELRQRLAKPAPDAKVLLDAANRASEHVAVLHIAFMAVCAYVLVILFGTTDLDLLMGGNNVKLPVIDVTVPIVGFYAAAPYLVVLIHLNLLLQLQLLSRKLFAFAAAVRNEKDPTRLRDQLHIFPYTYYLVGRPSAVVEGLLGLVVSVTLVILPLATLLGLQIRFLAYQEAGITWAQRIAVFADVGLLLALWPVILHPRDDWKAWWRETVAAYLPTRWRVAGVVLLTVGVVLLMAGVVLILFGATQELFSTGLILGAMAPLLMALGRFSRVQWFRVSLLVVILWSLATVLVPAILLIAMLWGLGDVLGVWLWDHTNSLPSIQPALLVALYLGMLPLACFWRPTAPRGSLVLLTALVLTPLLTLGLVVDGESWEAAMVAKQKPLLAWRVLAKTLKLLERDSEQSLVPFLALGLLMDGESWEAAMVAMQKPLLAQRVLESAFKTRADLIKNNYCTAIGQNVLSCVILADQRRLHLIEQSLFAKQPSPEILADLRAGKGLEHKNQLERISLQGRSLRRAQMASALLVGADLREAQLEGADLSVAQLQGADLRVAQLEGADLSVAQLQGADLRGAQLQGADLRGAQLQGADLRVAHLEGADLSWAHLEGADLWKAHLEDADLSLADLEGADLWKAQLQGADLREAQLQGADLWEAQLQGADLWEAHLEGADLSEAQLQGADLSEADLEGADLRQANLYRNNDPNQSDLLDIRNTAVSTLSQKEFSTLQSMLKPTRIKNQEASLQRLEEATKPGAAPPKFASCLKNAKSQPICQHPYDATNREERDKFVKDLHPVLATLSCKDTHIASGIMRQIPDEVFNQDSTRAGLATVLLARMQAKEPCPGLAGLSAENKATLEKRAMKEAERQTATKATPTPPPRRTKLRPATVKHTGR